MWLEKAEIGLVTLILGYGILFHTGYLFRVAPNSELWDMVELYGGLFFLPLALAFVSLLSAIFAESFVRSYLTGAVAMVMLLGILASWAMYFSPRGGGIVIGPFLSFGFGLILAIVVLLKQTTLRLQPFLAELR
ncbi:hypothetical protein [Natrinema salsiterrestre]|uniref:Uncharacterized protein n=1 Tax=Natrinema salsiterrestre TaxID=2950540 RepID=A0A9Q4KY35_9EURY|nr:hypothetical protein [Natrinema salsiterrestre]MDF9745915.1 hypothetical protein [Natrinema salsiterrestre]